MIKTLLSGKRAEVANVEDEALLVHVVPHPPLVAENRSFPFFGSFTVNGDGVTENLNVDGSVNPVEAFLGSVPDGDIYIQTANVLIADSGVVSLNRFGGASELTNGVNLFFDLQNDRTTVMQPFKSNFDFIRAGTLTEGTGGKNDAYQLANADASNNDGYNPVLDLTRVSQQGVRLRRDEGDRIGIIINDDLTGVSTFEIRVTGFVRF